MDSIIEIFQANLVEEWTHYHDGKYLPNAKKYVEETITGRNSDLLNIEQVYLKTGGEFSVLVSTKDNKVFGMCALEKKSPTEGELRRMCLRPCVRRQGCGDTNGINGSRSITGDGIAKIGPQHSRARRRRLAILRKTRLC